MLSLQSIKEIVVPLAQQYGLERIFLFGSYARGEATETSDIDFRIDKGSMRGLKFCGFYSDMEASLKRPLDILTTQQLPKDFLNAIHKEEILLYERK
jgi:hypothetical protein